MNQALDTPRPPAENAWPELPLQPWIETRDTLHMWTQIVGKIILAHTPLLNHWWNCTFHVTPRGLLTPPLSAGTRSFQMEFDFQSHHLNVWTSDGLREGLPLVPRSVAEFYGEVMGMLSRIGIQTRIWKVPVEVAKPVPFDRDFANASYDAEAAHRCWLALVQADRVMRQFGHGFLGKASPIHFFWGSFDMAVTRFSGRAAPPHPGGIPSLADWVTREAYSHEVSSAGWWPGGGLVDEPAFYSYAYPEPSGFRDHPLRSAAAFYHDELREFILPYEAVRTAANPDRLLLEFLQDTYEAAAEAGGWDRPALERTGDTHPASHS